MNLVDLPHPFPFTCEYSLAEDTSTRRVIVEEVFGRKFKIRAIAPLTVAGKERGVRLDRGEVFSANPEELDLTTAIACRQQSPAGTEGDQSAT